MDNIFNREGKLFSDPHRQSAFKPIKLSSSNEVSLSKELEFKMEINDNNSNLESSWDQKNDPNQHTYYLSDSLQKMLESRLSNSMKNESTHLKKSGFNNQKFTMEISNEKIDHPFHNLQPLANTAFFIPYGIPSNYTNNCIPVKRIGPLSYEERSEKIKRYLEKKKNRKWKTVRYKIRKTLADQRERVHGRFVKVNKEVQNENKKEINEEI